MNNAMALRKQLNAQLEEEGIKLSVNDFVMKAAAVALRNHPNLNAIYTTRGVELHEKVDMAMAVALDQGDRKSHTSELQSRQYLVCRLLLEKKTRASHVHRPSPGIGSA